MPVCREPGLSVGCLPSNQLWPTLGAFSKVMDNLTTPR